MYIIVCPLVFLASCVDAIGGGGGLISWPAYWLSGIGKELTGGSNKFSASLGTLVATIRYFKSGKIMLAPALLTAAGSLCGAPIGVELYDRVPSETVKLFMLCAIPVVFVIMLLTKNVKPQEKQLGKIGLGLCFAIGLACGAYDGFFGPGTGMFLILLLTLVVGMDKVTASATSKVANLASNVMSLVLFISKGYVLYALAVPAALCSIAGGYLGAKLALRYGGRFVFYVMLVVLLLMLPFIIFFK
ncbi:sulfite exporter TauE/SafE family protein [Eubacteriales bacterium OttesenSCG-928-N13]|nr:sulfite exporter TauE/SafE family protein [Eubacteriales bacterium OttesenSCG-928-N13]